MRPSYRTVKRKNTSGKTYYQIRFLNPDGTIIKSLSCPEAKSAIQACRIAESELKKGVIAASENPLALEYLKTFWSRTSDYVQGRSLRGTTISERYLDESWRVIDKHFTRFLSGVKLLDIDTNYLESAILTLSREGVGPRRINCGLQAIRVPINYFCKMHRIPSPVLGVEKLAERTKERGSLSAKEVREILTIEDEAPRAKAAVLLGALCGLRLGEVRALRWEHVDLEENIIHIVENYVTGKEGVKAPKSGSSRIVPLPDPVRKALELCRAGAPKGARFIIWNDRTAELPACAATIQHGFKRILKTIRINEVVQKKRGLVFHSLRHTFVSLSRAQGLSDFVVQSLAGHKSSRMMERYSHAENVVDFNEARRVMESALKVSNS